MLPRQLFLLPTLLLIGGCESAESGAAALGSGATSGVASGGATTTETTAFTCDAAAKPPAASLRRLTMSQFRNTIVDFIAFATGDATQAAAVLSEVGGSLQRLPTDRREPTSDDLHGSYRRLDQSLQQLHVDGYYDVGVAVAAALTKPERLAAVVGVCATDADASNDASCLREAVARLGARALRRPLTEDERAFYESVYGSEKTANASAYADVLAVLLNAPQLVYFVEHGEREVAAKKGVFELSPHELASRLSYQLWQTAPDAELLASAASGALLEAGEYRRQVERLLADPRARSALDEFFADWTKAEELPALDAKNADPVFQAFAGEQRPSSKLRQDMIDDVLGLLGYFTWQQPAPVAQLFRTDLSFARSQELAALYGIPAWDGKSTPPSFSAGERPGLLTRARFLATGSPNTRPIMKGLFIRKYVLCDDIPPPPPGANAKPPELEPGMTTRETVEALTQMPGTVCSGCHSKLLNPLGFATESFDALGRYRTEQTFFDAQGNLTGAKPIDTRGVPHVLASSDAEVAGASELMTQIVESGKVEACLSRNFFRYTFARWEDVANDGCILESMRDVLTKGGSLVDLVMTATLDGSFKQRAFE